MFKKKETLVASEKEEEVELDLNDKSLFEFQIADESASEHIAAPKYSYWGSVWRRFFSNKIAMVMLFIALAIILFSFIQPLFSHYDHMNTPYINNASMRYVRPFKMEGYLFGTDDSGRNLFDALWAGTKTSLTVAILATLITESVGVLVGMWWGFSKKVDAVMIEVYNVLANIPTTLIAMILVYATGSGIPELVFALSITTWIGTAYFIRVQVMIIRDREYNLASQCLGTPLHKIILNNILPYLISIIITSVSRDIPLFISSEVALSYMGVGLSQAYVSLGRMVQQYASYMTSAGYLFWIPVTTAAIISISLYIVGQALADASDPRTHMM